MSKLGTWETPKLFLTTHTQVLAENPTFKVSVFIDSVVVGGRGRYNILLQVYSLFMPHLAVCLFAADAEIYEMPRRTFFLLFFLLQHWGLNPDTLYHWATYIPRPLFYFSFWERVSLGFLGWLWTCNPLPSASWVAVFAGMYHHARQNLSSFSIIVEGFFGWKERQKEKVFTC